MAKISINIKDGSINKTDFIVGIDLGTTNSLIAIIDKKTNVPFILKENKEHVLVPSVLYFQNDNIILGNQAKSLAHLNPENSIFSIKRLLGKSYHDIKDLGLNLNYKIIENQDDRLVKIQLGQQFYTPIELSAMILAHLKSIAEAQLKAEIKKCVITVPAYFNDSQRQATRDAGKLAGLDVLRIINEPTAASLAYGIGLDNTINKKIVVYDFGGGTFDISILHIQEGIFEVLATNGDTFLGGDDFDYAIIEYWKPNLSHLNLNKSVMMTLKIIAEQAKITVCSNLTFNDFIEIDNQKINLTLTADQFNLIAEPIIKKTIICCENALKDAAIAKHEISEIVMVGGSTRIPLVQNMVKLYFEKIELNHQLNPDEVVALGAAIEADILAGNRKDILLVDVTPLSLGIETLGGLMDVLIPRNSKIPCKASRQYTTSKDGQSKLKISVFQGERDQVIHNRKLAEFELTKIPSMPAGFPKIEIEFILNSDGILKVKAKELRSNTEQEIIVKPQYGLTDEEVEHMLLGSITNAKTDIEMRSLIEAKTEAEQLIYITERFMDKNSLLLNTDQQLNTKSIINNLKSALDTNDKNLILSHTSQLNEYTKPFAEMLMDIAIKNNLKGKSI